MQIATKSPKILQPLALGLALGLSGCGQSGQFADLPSNFSDFRRAHLYTPDQQTIRVAQDIMGLGGNAVDMTIAMSLATVTSMPNKVRLRSKGQCVAFESQGMRAYSVDFTTPNTTLLHGMNGLYASFGSLPWSSLLAPAQRLALFGASGTNSTTAAQQDDAEALQILMRYPLEFAKFPPFDTDPIWQQPMTIDQAALLQLGDNILATVAQSGFSENRASPRGANTAIVVGAVDVTGLAVLCSIDTQNNNSQSQTLPRMIMAYNANNAHVKWVSAYGAEVADTAILADWQSLLNENRLANPNGRGYVMTYCPIGLPSEDKDTAIQCTAINGQAKALGFASRH